MGWICLLTPEWHVLSCDSRTQTTTYNLHHEVDMITFLCPFTNGQKDCLLSDKMPTQPQVHSLQNMVKPSGQLAWTVFDEIKGRPGEAGLSTASPTLDLLIALHVDHDPSGVERTHSCLVKHTHHS